MCFCDLAHRIYMTHRVIDDETLASYLAGGLTPEESASIEQALVRSSDDYKVVDQVRSAREVFRREGRLELSEDMQNVRRQVESFIASSPSREAPDFEVRHRLSVNDSPPVRAGRWFSNWALVTPFLVAALVWGVLKVDRSMVGSEGPGLASVYSTSNGHQASLSLPDGSHVILNVGSRLEVPSNFGTVNRQVRLAGEAVFTVAHRSSVPFSVAAGSTTTTVLGTVFKVRKYDSDTAVSVDVREGRVSVQSTVLTANESAIVTSSGDVSTVAMDLSSFDFIDGKLTISNLPLADAVRDLSRWYDADIQIGSPGLATQKVGGTFTLGSREELINILEKALGFRVIQQGRMLTVYE